MASPPFTSFTIQTIQTLFRFYSFLLCPSQCKAKKRGSALPSPSASPNTWRWPTCRNRSGPVLFSFSFDSFDSFDFRLDFVNRISRCIDLRSKQIFTTFFLFGKCVRDWFNRNWKNPPIFCICNSLHRLALCNCIFPNRFGQIGRPWPTLAQLPSFAEAPLVVASAPT